MMMGASTQVGNHMRTVRFNDSTIVPVAPIATELNKNGKKAGFKRVKLKHAAVSRPECRDGCRSSAKPTLFAKVGRRLSSSAKRGCKTRRNPVTQQTTPVLIQKNAGARVGNPLQRPKNTQVGK